MSTFSIIMFALTAFFAYQIYRHIQTLEDKIEPKNSVDTVPKPPHELNRADALIEEADEAYSEGDLERAQDKLNRANTQFPNNTEILNKLGFINGKLGNFDKAIDLYKRSIELDATDDLTHLALGSIYKSQGDFDKAQEHYEKALAIDTQYAITYYNYGNLFNDKGELAKAEEMYSKALALQDDFIEAREALAELKESK
ncbi:MAG: tetratricopeptide repeat protein [Sulfuricurvum sp.]|uniref:tetratricopeptide repeat protein n=1 Tax=Sulfuricurvum sp. TaxID=2025608 RepID=UPI002603CD79|nr:tetratricopeptide repeat protein [Sulfuricurvum sp.]MDD2829211.1 tetratricopeptide repeat protein [Sulfuricurvum sp.]MDD4949044.1 tetratricopeptide repeat protein [Sulfuricurvum sp.]